MSEIVLNWKRPKTVEFPKIWQTFKAKDLNSDELVEYRIEDVTDSNAEQVLEHMKNNYIPDEPIGQTFGGENDIGYAKDYTAAWRLMIKQKVPLVCYRSGSDEIVGANMNFIMSKDDHFMEKTMEQVKSKTMKNVLGVISVMYENFDPFEKYNVNEFMASFGLSVDRKYRGRGIGEQFLTTRRLLCKEFKIKFTQTIFSSDFSNRNADKVGFLPDVVIKYEDVIKSHPCYAALKNIKSQQMTVKTLMI